MASTFAYLDPLPPQTSPPEFQFIIANLTKVTNVGNIMRSAVAMGCKTCVVIGNRKVSGFGHMGTNQFLTFNYFPTLEDAQKSLKERGFDIVGVEIGTDARSILTPSECFTGPTCFLLGEEGHGMTPECQAICDRLVYIPQYGNGTHSLNVSNAAAIIFFHFANWAQYKQVEIEGEKFVIDATKMVSKVQKDENGDIVKDDNGAVVLNETQLAIRESRRLKKLRKEAALKDSEGEKEVQLGSVADAIETTE